MDAERGDGEPAVLRPESPGDDPGAVAFIASPDATYITGQAIYACGERTLAP